MVLGAGVLPSGNDVRGVILGDVTGAFLVGLPLAVLLGLHTPLGVAGVFLARVVEECAKVAIFTWRTAPAGLAPAGHRLPGARAAGTCSLRAGTSGDRRPDRLGHWHRDGRGSACRAR